MRNAHRFLAVILTGLLWTSVPASAQAPPPAARTSAPVPAVPSVPPPGMLASPRETLKTFYFAVSAYDFKPCIIDDAIACMEPAPDKVDTPAEAARFVVMLDRVLRELYLPINAVPEKPTGDTAVIFDGDGYHIAFHRQPDGAWKFDRATVERIPSMNRLALARYRDLAAQRAALRPDYTDAATTMRRFFIDAVTGDYYKAAQALDLRDLPADQRADKGPVLAQQLMFVIQRRGWIYFQEVPSNPDGPAYTWYADRSGRVALERVRSTEGKDAWLFSKYTVRNLEKMYQAALQVDPDPRYVMLKRVVPPVPCAIAVAGEQRPDSVPKHLGSPRATLRGFFRTMDEAEANEDWLADAVEYLDLEGMAANDRKTEGVKLALKLDAILRKLAVEVSSVADSWNAPTEIIGEEQKLRVEIARLRDGTWRFSRATIDHIPELFEKLSMKERSGQSRTGHLESARDTMVSFLNACNSHDHRRAARCLDLESVHPSARDAIGPVLAFKLKYVIDRIGRVYPQEIPDEPEGPRFLYHNDEHGRIVIARKTDGPDKDKWLFTPETVDRIEPMFLAVLGRPVDETLRNAPCDFCVPPLWDAPGVYLRLQVPPWGRMAAGSLEMYQWLGLVGSLLLSWVAAKLSLLFVEGLTILILKRSGSMLTTKFVRCRLRPLTWVVTCWLYFRLPTWLDLPVSWLNTVMPAQTFLMAAIAGWLGFQMIDLLMAIYTNSELIRPHRNLSDMIVPVLMRVLKTVVFLFVLGYVIYHVGHGESLVRFVTGLGAAGLAASLAAQDMLKCFFGTLLLISERSFKLGDRIKVDSHEGTVEQVGFRSTRLRKDDGSLVTIPNSTITSASIANQGVENTHRHTLTLALGKDMPVDEVAALRDRIHAWLHDHPEVNPDEIDVHVAITRDMGAELQIELTLRADAETDEDLVRQELNYGILGLIQAGGSPRSKDARRAA